MSVSTTAERLPATIDQYAEAQLKFARLNTAKKLPLLLAQWQETVEIPNEEKVAYMEFWLGTIFLVLSATDDELDGTLAQAVRKRMRELFVELCRAMDLDGPEMGRYFDGRMVQYGQLPSQTLGLPEWNLAFIFYQNVVGVDRASAIEVLPMFTYTSDTLRAVKETLEKRVLVVG